MTPPRVNALIPHLSANGIGVDPIVDGTPGTDRELALRDPDGYCLVVAETEVD